jgi:WD40 repeat protein/mono/diheme cytochrome c family protein
VRLWLLILFVASYVSAADQPVSWFHDIRPLFKTSCVSCHRPEKRKGKLDLTSYAGLQQGGESGACFKAHHPGDSLVVKQVSGEEPEMPPKGETLQLEEIELISRWLKEGALDDTPEQTPDFFRAPETPPIYTRLPVITSMAYHTNGTLLAVAGYQEILLYEPLSRTVVARLLGALPRLESLAFSPDGQLLAASGGIPAEFGEVQIWDLAKHTLQRRIRVSQDALYGVSWSPDSQRIAVGGADKMVRVFTVSDGKEVMRCDNHTGWVMDTAFTPDGKRLVSASLDKLIKLIDVETGQLVDDVNIPRDPESCLARHPTEALVAHGGEHGKIRLHKMEPRGGRLAEGDNAEKSYVRESEGLAPPIQALAFNHDGSLFAAAGDKGEVHVFKTENGRREKMIKLETAVFTLAFHPTTNLIVAAGADGMIHELDVSTGKERQAWAAVPLSQEANPEKK